MKFKQPAPVFEEITEADIPSLTKAMTLAFDDDTQTYLGEKGGPEGYDNGDFFRKWLFSSYKESRGFKIILNKQIIGGFIVWIYGHGKNILGTIFVSPEYQRNGIGGTAWKFIEQKYPDTKSWVLTTPSYSIRNHHFYEKKCDFTKVGEKPAQDSSRTEFIYRKVIK